ncbi:FAD-dependent oxidoreductase [Dongia sp.]|uniref:FAD-dependent oxidoreductase n=1 Tax=Dongia sp. TaxID=1977262 RepID=UPI0035B4E455
MSDVFDTVVVGAGVFGIATALELAKRGQRVAIVDRFGSGHEVTSSTGASRSIRLAYDHPFYVQLAMQAIEAWGALEKTSGRRILHLTGQVDIGSERKLSALMGEVTKAGCRIDMLAGSDFKQRFPEMALQPGERALFHAQAGTVMAEVGMKAMNEAAAKLGVAMFAPEAVTGIARNGDGVRVTTAQRHVVAAKAVVAAGPWSGALLRPLGIDLPLAPAIAQVTFLDAPGLVDRPGFAEWKDNGEVGYYGHPVPGIGYKVAFDAGAEGWDGDVTSWSPDMGEEARLLAWFADRFPGHKAKVAKTQRHPWTMMPDVDFIVDAAGGEWGDRLILACGCSGHAFKFGPALGPLVADVVEKGRGPDLLRVERAGLKAAAPKAGAPITR